MKDKARRIVVWVVVAALVVSIVGVILASGVREGERQEATVELADAVGEIQD